MFHKIHGECRRHTLAYLQFPERHNPHRDVPSSSCIGANRYGVADGVRICVFDGGCIRYRRQGSNAACWPPGAGRLWHFSTMAFCPMSGLLPVDSVAGATSSGIAPSRVTVSGLAVTIGSHLDSATLSNPCHAKQRWHIPVSQSLSGSVRTQQQPGPT